MSFLKKLVTVLAVACAPAVVLSQGYPVKPIRLLVPYSAGGGADNAARLLSPRLSSSMGPTGAMDTRSGDGGRESQPAQGDDDQAR
mgnify:CR=1 FL=1